MQPAERRDLTHTGALVTPDGQRHKAHFYIGAADEVISSTKTAYAANAALTDPDARHLLMVGFARDGDALPVNAQFPTLTILQVAANRDLQLPPPERWPRGSRLHHRIGAGSKAASTARRSGRRQSPAGSARPQCVQSGQRAGRSPRRPAPNGPNDRHRLRPGNPFAPA